MDDLAQRRDATEATDRYRGILLGLAVGDALGTTLEFRRPGSFRPITDMVGGGPFGLNPGEWTDDTSMAPCLAESLIECQGFDPADPMRRYVRWHREGYLSSNGRCFDIGATVRSALGRFERTRDPYSGPTDPHSAGNGSLMRLAPVPLFYAARPGEAITRSAEISGGGGTTHRPRRVDGGMMANRRAAAALLVFASIGALVSVSCRGVPAVRPTERDLSLAIEHDGRTREFILHLPPNHDRLGRMPLIIALHGGGGTAEGMIRLTKGRFDELADAHGFLAAYPQGSEKSWNDDRDDPISYAHENDVDDIGFLSALIERLTREYGADPERVFATGMSNGGFMSLRISREMTDRVRAVAPVCATIPQAARDAYLEAPAMSILLLNGTSDPLVPYDGGFVQVLGRKRGAITSTDATIEVFRKRNGAWADALYSELPDTDPGDGTRVARYEYVNTATGNKVVLLKVEGGGHAWPGGWPYLGERLIGRTSMDINACDVIWEFFRSLEP